MSWLSRLLGGDKPHMPRSLQHRLGWPEQSESEPSGESVWPLEHAATSANLSVVESPDEAAERERGLKKKARRDKPAQRGRRQRKRK